LTDTRIHFLLHGVLRQGNRYAAFELAEVFNNVSHGFNRPKIIRANSVIFSVPHLRACAAGLQATGSTVESKEPNILANYLRG
jgi:hypothetical protein